MAEGVLRNGTGRGASASEALRPCCPGLDAQPSFAEAQRQGISSPIENHAALRAGLEAEGAEFETDTETFVRLVDRHRGGAPEARPAWLAAVMDRPVPPLARIRSRNAGGAGPLGAGAAV